MNKRLILSCAILLVVVCVCLSLVLIPAPFLLFNSRITVSEAVPSTPGREEAPIPAPVFTPQAPMPGADPSENLPPEIASQMDEIQQQVVTIRGLAAIGTLRRELLTPEMLQVKVAEEFFEDYSVDDAAEDVLVLSAFGLIEPGYDLYGLYVDLYNEQVAGYYDNETETMYVVQREGFFGPQRMTYAHEFVHALQDQHYDLKEGLKLNDETCEQDSEYCAATNALVEGDASLVERFWLWRYSTDEDRQQVINFYRDFHSPIFDSAPDFLKEDFLFPYVQGLEFVETLYDLGGWGAVDAAYLDPPRTTTHILHPDKYPNHQAVEVVLPDLLPVLGDGWEQIDDNVIGEWYTYLMLARGWLPRWQIAAISARQAAAGWAGDRSHLYYHAGSDEIVLVQRWLWEDADSAAEFWGAFNSYARARWGSPASYSGETLEWSATADGEVILIRSGSETLWVMAPDAVIADLVTREVLEHQEP